MVNFVSILRPTLKNITHQWSVHINHKKRTHTYKWRKLKKKKKKKEREKHKRNHENWEKNQKKNINQKKNGMKFPSLPKILEKTV